MPMTEEYVGRFEEVFTLYQNLQPLTEREAWEAMILTSSWRHGTSVPQQKPLRPRLSGNCGTLCGMAYAATARPDVDAAEAEAGTARPAGWNGWA